MNGGAEKEAKAKGHTLAALVKLDDMWQNVINFSVNTYHNLTIICESEVLQEECSTKPDPASCTVDLEDRRFWRGEVWASWKVVTTEGRGD